MKKEISNMNEGFYDVRFPKVPFLVRILTDKCYYRNMPMIDSDVIGKTGIGTFTIVEVQNGCGRLKSGDGWISLEESMCEIFGSVSDEAPDQFIKTVSEMVEEIQRGEWGEEDEQERRLTEAGYNYSLIKKELFKP